MMGWGSGFRRNMPRALAFLGGSVAAQGLSAVTGLLLARWLSVPDYALYTIAMTLLGAVAILTKGGVHLAFSARLGQVWPDQLRAGQLVAATLQTRRLISLLMLPPVLAVAAALFHRNGADSLHIATLLGLLILAWWGDLRVRVIDQVLNFAHQTTRLQVLDATLAGVRLLAVMGLWWSRGLGVVSATAIGAAVALLRQGPVRVWIERLAPHRQAEVTSEDTDALRQAIRRQLPVELYMVMQTQIALFLLSFMAPIDAVAGYGALTRLNQLLVPVEAFTYAFCVPIFARAQTQLIKLLTLFVVITALPGIMMVLVAAQWPRALLWLVGENYAGLQNEVLIAAAVAAFVRAATTFWNLIAHRGYLRFSWLQIPLGIIWIAISPLVLNLGTLAGALFLQVGFAAIMMVVGIIDFTSARRMNT